MPVSSQLSVKKGMSTQMQDKNHLTAEKKMPLQRHNTQTQKKTANNELEAHKHTYRRGHLGDLNDDRLLSEQSNSMLLVDGPPIGHKIQQLLNQQERLQTAEDVILQNANSTTGSPKKKLSLNAAITAHDPEQKRLSKLYKTQVKKLKRQLERSHVKPPGNKSPESLSLEKSLSNQSTRGYHH